MSLRFHQLLLTVAILVMLNACTTTGSRPGKDAYPEKDFPSQTDTRDSDLQRDPSERSLAEVNELSNSISSYQPDLALEILRSLESVSSSQLNTMINGQLYDPEFTEWFELALQVRSLLISGSPVAAAVQNWANYHYGHVVTRANYPELVSRYAACFPMPSQVAILLPTEGGLAAAGKAIRDGILSAYLEQPGESAIRFYSSGENDESAIAAYHQAREDGATQIVGPLRVESTHALASLDSKDVPILLLNKPASSQAINPDQANVVGSQAVNPDQANVMGSLAVNPDQANVMGSLAVNPDQANVVGNQVVNPDQANVVGSLSLSQTEEAAVIAANALAQGQDRAIVIVPYGTWGKHIETAFTTVFTQGEGNISAAAYFNPDTSDHSTMLTQLLKIDESKQREADLQSRLGIPLVFEPIRRDDFDFIFMAADPAKGRELKPLLRFHDAGDIPVYAMSRIFSGKMERSFDQDLNGIVFAITPWQLQASGSTTLNLESLRDGAFGNLYALGQDAWHLLPWLPLMQKDPDLWFPGSIGSLRLQANGILYRQPAWAQFSAGRPIPYRWPDNH